MNDYNIFISHIKGIFNYSNLPGLEAQLKMSPITRRLKESSFNISSNARRSAILILFYPVNDKPHVVMMKRPHDNTVHSGQVSFPGGKVENSDKTLIDTALREANEEIGIDIDSINVIGQLTKLYIPPSNFDVYPIVGYVHSQPEFIINEEVDKLMEVALEELLNPNNKTYKKIYNRDGNEFVVPCYYVQDEVIWGATGMILAELLEVISS